MIGQRGFVGTTLAESVALLPAPRTAKAIDSHIQALIGELIKYSASDEWEKM